MFGPCPQCAEGKPFPTTGNNPTFQDHHITMPGQLLHVDIVFVNKQPYLFSVDEVSHFMSIVKLVSKKQPDLTAGFLSLLNAYRACLKTTQFISADHEKVFKSSEEFLGSQGVQLLLRIPGEHERVAERGMRRVREAIRTKTLELPYRHPPQLLHFLVAHIVDCFNMVPNSRSTPLIPYEMVKGEKVNFRTDVTALYGQLALVVTRTPANGYTERKNELGICLGRVHNAKGAVWILRKSNNIPVARRVIQAIPMTHDWITYMNEYASQVTTEEEGFTFTEKLIENSTSTSSDHASVRVPPTSTDAPVPAQPSLTPAAPPAQTVSAPAITADQSNSERPAQLIPSPEVPVSVLPTEQPTLIQATPDISGPAIDTSDTIVSRSGRTIRSSERLNLTATLLSVRSAAAELRPSPSFLHMQRDLSEAITSSAADSSFPFPPPLQSSNHAWCYALTLQSALKTKWKDDVEKAAVKECKNLIDFKVWHYLKSRDDASPSVHKNILPCSLIIKDKRDSHGNLIAWKGRLANGGHRTDPAFYNPNERTSPTAHIDSIYTFLAYMHEDGDFRRSVGLLKCQVKRRTQTRHAHQPYDIYVRLPGRS
jgi:hypothetical protein